MSKPDGLFCIREIAAYCGVSINTLRFYNEKGLLAPAYIAPGSGYRYYSLQNLHRLQNILALKSTGLSLGEIKTALDDTVDWSDRIARLSEQRARLTQMIDRMSLRKTACCGTPAVREIFLPERLCLCRTIHAKDGAHALTAIGEFYGDVIRAGVRISRLWPEFCEYPDTGLLSGSFSAENFTVTACIPIDAQNAPPEAVCYPAGQAVTTDYLGSYLDLWRAYDVLRDYLEHNGYAAAGYAQEEYVDFDTAGTLRLDSLRNITRVIIPVSPANNTPPE